MIKFDLLTNKVTEATIRKLANAIKHPFKAGKPSTKFGGFIK